MPISPIENRVRGQNLALSVFMSRQKQDKFERYTDIVVGTSKGTTKQNEMLSRYRFAFGLICDGYTPLVVSKVLAEKYDISQGRGFKIIREAKIIFGDAGEFSKKGSRYAMYEYMMRLSKNAEKAGDYSTARNCAMDAAKLLGLDQPDHEGLINPMDFMNPDEFVISTNPKVLDAYERTIEMTIDVSHDVVEPELNSNVEENEDSQGLLS